MEQCSTQNFRRRQACFTCGTARQAGSRTVPANSHSHNSRDGSDETGTTPCNVLIVRGLDPNTQESAIFEAFAPFGAVSALRLIRDRGCYATRGFCFVEYSTVEQASEILRTIQGLRHSLTIDGQRVMVSFSRDRSSGKINDAASAAIAAAMAIHAVPAAPALVCANIIIIIVGLHSHFTAAADIRLPSRSRPRPPRTR
eukprot:m.144130 g.144130  ORF g.144130 m.144130 type:complete len:199 (-) comp9669_c0_seq1:1425-2021(-)